MAQTVGEIRLIADGTKVGFNHQLLMIAIPSSFLAVMGGAFIANSLGKDLNDDPVYQDRLAKGLVSMDSGDDQQAEITPEAKRAVLIFGVSIFAVVSYAMAISSTDCRERTAHGEPVWYLVPDGVVQHIGKYHLYSKE